MRSFGSTIFLALAAAVICGLAALQWHQGNFDLILGKPPTAVGEALYDSFEGDDVARIIVTTDSRQGTFVRQANGWQATSPWNDRMSPEAAASIIGFTLGMRVEDHAPEDKVEPAKSGLSDKDAIHLRLESRDGTALATYRLGRVSPWKTEIEGSSQPINTVFVQTEDKKRRSHVYIVTGDITQLFQDNLKLLRDHRPFYFNPLNLQKISIHSQQGDLTLGHETPVQAWRILKPLDLATDTGAINTLLSGLAQLRATRVSERSEVTLPTSGATTKTTQISITRFGSERPTVLEIYPPESLDGSQVKAVVSDRPNTVFELPLNPAPGIISLADLPLDVNALRDPTLTHLNRGAVKAIAITPATGPPILISREPGEAWMATAGGKTFTANEVNLYSLLKAVTTTRAIGFESDAAADFSPWGLDRPILRLRFLAINNEAMELRFGINSKGDYFVNRLGTSTVMRIDPSLIQSIAILPHEWKHSLLWSINSVYLSNLEIKRGDAPPLVLHYDFHDESWQAESDGRDVTPQLVPNRANNLLKTLEGPRVSRWLAPGDSGALSALTSPSLTITTTEKIKDQNDKEVRTINRSLILAPATEPEFHGHHYGLSSASSNPFLIDANTYRKLAADLLEQ